MKAPQFSVYCRPRQSVAQARAEAIEAKQHRRSSSHMLLAMAGLLCLAFALILTSR